MRRGLTPPPLTVKQRAHLDQIRARGHLDRAEHRQRIAARPTRSWWTEVKPEDFYPTAHVEALRMQAIAVNYRPRMLDD